MINLIHDNCVDAIAKMPDKSVDLIIADPPYKLEMPKKSGVDTYLKDKKITLVDEDWDKFTLDEYMVFSEEWITQAMRLLKDHGSIFIFGSYHNIGLVNYVLQKNKIMIINEIIWYKRNAVPNLACRRFTASTENILWAAKDKKYTFNYHAMKNGDFPEDNIKKPEKQMRNVWDIPTAGKENVGHPTQKPTKVYERIIKSALIDNPDAVVLDPFAGSGTLGAVAQSMNLNCTMIEANDEYISIIKNRLGL